MPFLIVEKGSDKGRAIKVEEARELVVGRSPHADLTLHEPAVSRRHFRIFSEQSSFAVEDLDSANGTFLDGRNVEREVLDPGTRIRVGESILLFLSEEEYRKRKGLIGEVISGYEIVEQVGKGGMGVVYKAIQQHLDREVALKILSKDKKEKKNVERFINEARSAARLNHPNLVKVFDAARVEDLFYIAMEYIPGGSVKDILSREGTIEPEKSAKMIRDAARGLQYAESKSLVHRDIKPDNLMISEKGTIKIIDLGVAKGVGESSEEKMVLGTPHYIAPEQVRKENVDIRSDLYALGSTFFRMVTGARPFTGDTSKEVVRRKIHQTPPRARELNSSVPGWMDTLIFEMMEPDPENRISSPEEVIHRIDQGLSGEEEEAFFSGSFLEERESLVKVAQGVFMFLLVSGTILFGLFMSGVFTGDKAANAESGNAPDQQAKSGPSELLKTVRERYGTVAEDHSGQPEDLRLSELLETKKEIGKFRSFLEGKAGKFRNNEERAEYRKYLQSTTSRLNRLKEVISRRRRTRHIQDRKKNLRRLQSLWNTFLQEREIPRSEWKKRISNLESLRDAAPESLRSSTGEAYGKWKRRWNQVNQFEEIRTEVLDALRGNSFGEAFEVLNRAGNTFQEKQYQEKISLLRSRVEDEELQVYEGVLKKVRRLENQHLYEKAIEVLETSREQLHTKEFRSDLRNRTEAVRRKKQISREQQASDDDGSVDEEQRFKKERTKTAQVVLKMLRSVYKLPEEEPKLIAVEEFYDSDHKKIYRFYRFIVRMAGRFWNRIIQNINQKNLLDLNFHLVTEDKVYLRKVKSATRRKIQLEFLRSPGYQEIQWENLSIQNFLSFASENWKDFTAEDYLALSSMYYLHRARREGNQFIERARYFGRKGIQERERRPNKPEKLIPSLYRKFVENGEVPGVLRTFMEELLGNLHTKMKEVETKDDFISWMNVVKNGISSSDHYQRFADRFQRLEKKWE